MYYLPPKRQTENKEPFESHSCQELPVHPAVRAALGLLASHTSLGCSRNSTTDHSLAASLRGKAGG